MLYGAVTQNNEREVTFKPKMRTQPLEQPGKEHQVARRDGQEESGLIWSPSRITPPATCIHSLANPTVI